MPLHFCNSFFGILDFESVWGLFIGKTLSNCNGNLHKMQFWSFIKIAHKVTSTSLDRFMHRVQKLDDSPGLERKFGTADGKGI